MPVTQTLDHVRSSVLLAWSYPSLTAIDPAGALAIEPTILAQLLVFGLLLGGIYGFTALGLTIIFGVMNVINVAHGALMVVGMYTVWYVATTFGVSPFLAIPVAVLLLFVLGLVVFRLTLASVIEVPAANSLVVTLGLLLVLIATVELVFSATPRTLDIERGSVGIGGVHVPTGQLYAVLIALVAFVAVWLLLHHTRLGRAIRGTADNRMAAAFVGLDVSRVDHLTFGLGAALAGLAGGLIPLVQPFDPYLGNHYLTIAFVVVVLGGLGSVAGALVGGLVIGMIHVFGAFFLPGSSYEMLIFLLFILVLLFKPTGLLGSDHG